MGTMNYKHGGNIYEVERGIKKKIIDFSANINPLGLSSAVKKSLRGNLDKILHYPESEPCALLKKIAGYWGINKNNILLGNGSAELIYLVMAGFKPQNVAIPAPVFCEYERAARNKGSRISFVTLREKDGYKIDLSAVGKTDVLFLCNPNNPTGNIIAESPQAVKKIDAGLVVADEAFMDFLPDQKEYSLIWEAVRDEKIIVLRSFTKFFALPGLRLGYLIAHKKIIDKLKKYQAPWNTNVLAQAAVEAALDDRGYIKKTHRLIKSERNFLYDELGKIKGIKTYPSLVNFILVKIEAPDMDAEVLKEKLIEKGFLIRDCGNFRNLGGKYVRIAVRLRGENKALICALREVMHT